MQRFQWARRSGGIALGVGVALVCAAAAADTPGWVYSRAPEAVVLEFHEQPGEVAASEGGVSLRIHGDGRFVARRPPGMRGAGEHAGRMTPAELDALLERLAARGVFDFEDETPVRETSVRGGTLARETSDPSRVTLVIRAHREAPGAAPVRETRIRVRGLRGAARAAPPDSALAGLAAGCTELRGLIDAAVAGDPS